MLNYDIIILWCLYIMTCHDIMLHYDVIDCAIVALHYANITTLCYDAITLC